MIIMTSVYKEIIRRGMAKALYTCLHLICISLWCIALPATQCVYSVSVLPFIWYTLHLTRSMAMPSPVLR